MPLTSYQGKNEKRERKLCQSSTRKRLNSFYHLKVSVNCKVDIFVATNKTILDLRRKS